jgi:hypothetical protein
MNVTTGRLHGLQSAAGLNLAEEAEGLQLSGGANVARDVRGAQIGVINAAQTAAGLRLGVVNVGHDTGGFSLGVINVAAHEDGESFALLNFVGNGIHDLTLFGTDALLSNVGLKLGGRHLYTSFTFSYQPGDDVVAGPVRIESSSRRWGYGGGLGWRQPVGLGRLTSIDIEAVTNTVSPTLESSGSGVMLNTARATLNVALTPNVSLLFGAGLNVMVGTDNRDFSGALSGWGPTYHDGTTTVRLYPGLLLGMQVGSQSHG